MSGEGLEEEDDEEEECGVMVIVTRGTGNSEGTKGSKTIGLARAR